MFKKYLILIAGIAALFSCGGSSSQSSGGDGNGSGSGNPSGTNTPNATQIIGESFDHDNGIYSASVNGKAFETSPIYSDPRTGQPFLYQSLQSSERMAFIAIEGDYVTGFGGSYYHYSNKIDDFAFYGLDGTPNLSAQSGTIQYSGAYMTADASNPNGAVFIYEANLSVNFDSGAITGSTVQTTAPDSQISFSGTVDGNNVFLSITDQYGTHNATGAIYGSSAQEIAAGYEDDGISGLIYGEK